MKKAVAIGLCFVMLIMSVSCGMPDEQRAEETPEKRQERIVKEKNDFIALCKVYDYQDIYRNAEDYVDQPAAFTGEVVQYMDDYYPDADGYRICVAKDEYGIHINDIFVLYPDEKNDDNPDGENRYIEGDIVNVYGILDGLNTYETVNGADRTIPAVKGYYIDLIK